MIKTLHSTFYITFFILAFGLQFTHAQVGIGTTSPQPGAILDISTTDKGILVPRVNISSLSTIAPITGGATEGLLVYNTNATTGTGFHYWNGSVWIPILSDDWKSGGNTGTTPGTSAGQNFLGTSDNTDFVMATNGTERFRITNDGRFLATHSGVVDSPMFAWSGDPNKGIYSPGIDQLGLVTDGVERLRIPNANQIHAMNNGSNTLPFYSWSNDANTGMYHSDTDRLNFSAGGLEFIELLEGSTDQLIINDTGVDLDTRIETNNNENTLFVDGGNDNIGIGTNTPNGILDMASSTMGMVPPRVSLTSTIVEAPILNPQGGSIVAGTCVYNTNTAGSSPNNVAPGLYFWNGTRWVAFAGSPGGLDWTLTGNSGTTPITNYLGTIDDVALVMSTNSNPKIIINSDNTENGEVIVNSTGYFANNMFQSFANGAETAIGGYGATGAQTFYGQNTGGGTVGTFLNTAGDGMRSLTSLPSGNGIQATGGAFTSFAFPGISSGGVFAGTYGASGISTSATGTGVAGLGQGRTTIVVNPSGSGVAASGNTLGLYAYAGFGDVAGANQGNAAAEFSLDADNDVTTNSGNDGTRARAKLAGFDNVTPDGVLANRESYYGGYFSGGSESSGTPSYAYVGMRYRTNSNGDGVLGGGQDYKIIGTGSVSTLIDGPDGTPRVMFAPEAPEILFQDFGVGQLINGEVRIEIDPILRKSIHVDDQNPLKVYVTLEGDCKGVYVTNKSGEGFTVKELQGGTSNAAFSWQLVASRADRIGTDGRMVSKHVGVRLPEGPGPVKSKEYKTQKVEVKNESLKDKPSAAVLKDKPSFSTQEKGFNDRKPALTKSNSINASVNQK